MASLMVFMMGLLAFAVDLGYIMNVQSELKRATDAAALAGAGALIDGKEQAELEAFAYLARNPVGGRIHTAEDDDGNCVQPMDPAWTNHAADLLAQNRDRFRVEWGHWNTDTRSFQQSDDLPSTLRVVARHDNAPLFFARALGHDRFSVSAESIARFQPRDIALVLDFSASMCYDSQLRRISEYGESNRAIIEGNLQEIYQDLGSPSYGSLPFTPVFATVVGATPRSPAYRQATVTFRSADVVVSSTKNLTSVKLQFSDGATQTFSSLSTTTGTFKGTGGNSSKRIDKVLVKSGTSDPGEWFADDYTTIKRVLGLNTVAYPYPSGSWDDYVSYVKTSSYINGAGYRKKYGFLTLINYWLEQKPEYTETPDLWKTREQPIGAVKDAVGVFLDYIQEVDCDDRVGLAIYNSPNQTALVEQTLTRSFDVIEQTVQHRQAGHYDRYTNIGAGLRSGILELEAHARPGAFKMIVLMTDGNANRPSNESTGRSYALEQALLAARKGYPVVTISLGIDADTALMQEIADLTKGIHFNIPGTEAVQNYSTQLREVFHRIAKDRPLALVR